MIEAIPAQDRSIEHKQQLNKLKLRRRMYNEKLRQVKEWRLDR